MSPDLGMPRKVFALAHKLGLHNDCIVSQKPCSMCEGHINLAFDFHYAGARNEVELVAAIAGDIRDDLIADDYEF